MFCRLKEEVSAKLTLMETCLSVDDNGPVRLTAKKALAREDLTGIQDPGRIGVRREPNLTIFFIFEITGCCFGAG